MRICGDGHAFVLGVGALVPMVVDFIPEDAGTKRDMEIGQRQPAVRNSMWGLHPVALQPKGVVMTFVDLGTAPDHGHSP